MTEIHDATAPFVEAEIKEHQAALVRQMVTVVAIICVMMILVGLHQ
jgi:CHASE3 domain sensor protein